MKKIFSGIAFVLLTTCGLSAQESYSLEDLFAIAAKQSDDIKLANIEYAMGKEEVKFYQSEAMPNINFVSGANYVSQSTKSQAMTGGEMMQLFPRLEGYSLNWNTSLKQPLITFGKVFSALRVAKLRKKSIKEILQLRKDTFYMSVIQAYSAAYLAQNTLKINEKAAAYSKKLLARMEKEANGGSIAKRDLLRIQALAKKDEAEVVMARSQKKIAYRRLANLTGLSTPESYELTFKENSPFLLSAPDETGTSLEFTLKRYESLIYKNNISYERSKLFPSVYLTGGITNQFMIPDTTDMTSKYTNYMIATGQLDTASASSFSLPFTIPEVSDYFNSEYFNYSIGLQVSWTIFSGRRLTSGYQQAKLKWKKSELELKKLKEKNETEIHEARDIIEVVSQNMEAVALQLKAANKAFEQANQDYMNGYADITTLLDIEKEQREAEKLMNQIRIQKILAISGLKIAVGEPIYKE